MIIIAPMKYTIVLSASVVFATAVLSIAQASQPGFTTPLWRGSPGAEYQSWEVFTVATNDGKGNLPDQSESAGSATLTQLNADAFLTGSGNIYNPAGISSFVVRDTATQPVGLVSFQARTLGAELDYSSVRLTYDLGSGVQSLTTIRIENDRGTILGASVSSQWDWDLRGLGVSSYEISFTAAGTSLSFDSATLDTLPATSTIPEPSTWALAGIGLGIVLIQSRRMRRA